MKENEWVKFGDKLPNLGKEIEVLKYDETIEKTKARLSGDCESIVFDVKENSYLHHNILQLKGWRYTIERRPDFSKLKRGDLIKIEMIKQFNEFDRIGYIKSMGPDKLVTSPYIDVSDSFGSSYNKNIKKITRINLKEKTFEEI